jgi:hypothetical protein
MTDQDLWARTRSVKEQWTRSACGQNQHVGMTTRSPTSSWCRCIARAEPCSGVRLCASSRMPRQCEEVALPEQAVNPGHERYHRGGRMQAQFPVSIGPWPDPSRGAFCPRVTRGGEVVAAAGCHSGRTTRIRGSTTQYRPARVRRRARSTTYLSLRIVKLQTPRQVVLNPCNRAGFDSEGPARWRAPTAE